MRANERYILLNGASPFYSVLDNKLNVLVLERGVSLVTGLEIEYFTVSASPGASASEHLATVEPAQEDNVIGTRNIKSLAVHLLGIERKRFVNSLGDGMVRHYSPDALSCAVTPFKIAGSAHKATEYL